MSKSNPAIKRKNFYLDQNKIKKVQKLLGARTETQAIGRALDLVLFRVEIRQSLKKVAGKGVVVEIF